MSILKAKPQELIRYSIFYSILLIVTILPLASFRFGEISSIFPIIEIIIIFFFSIYKPDALPLWLLFTYGGLIDLIYGLPVGISIIPIIITSFLLRNQRQIFYKKEFTIVFLGFALACLLFLSLKYTIFCWFFSYLFDPSLVLIQSITTIFTYPIAHYALQQVEKIIH
ncbi:MAG: Cell shape determining protein MreD [Rickettsiaceae bacterium]|jgi:rod shape-determining protein MreD|nr:Cell shape determining protein MreD [Rickettsiaceae bacterium]